mgnify:CR=1 FL=1
MPFRVMVDVSRLRPGRADEMMDERVYEEAFPGEWADVDRAALLAVLLSAKPKRQHRRKAILSGFGPTNKEG